MGRELMDMFRTFLNDIRKMDQVLRGLEYPPSWTLEGMNLYAIYRI